MNNLTRKDCVGMLPESIRLEYECVNRLHIFRSPDLPGLLVARTELNDAASDLIEAIKVIIKTEYGIEEKNLIDSCSRNLLEKIGRGHIPDHQFSLVS
ncbi:hypothetical protein [Roseomonas genomospecies 6]|uniref:hypothetical protein n=1 Tax=Roseomonas genomospecies 6 TaxID=214106 RepID=UPI0011F3A810|nr:hypothetical protein [Roseomonas genomospecies 6]